MHNLAVLSEAPGRDLELRHVLAELQVNTDQWWWMTVVDESPTNPETGRARIPLTAEINACSTDLRAKLSEASPEFILLAGRVALNVFKPDARMAKMHGEPFSHEGMTMFPVYNPEAVSRLPALRDEFVADLSLFKEIINA